MRNSAVASPKYLATTIGDFMGWQRPQSERRYTAAQLLPPDAGVLLFQSRCAACHTVGKGDAVGPDLAGVTTRRDRAWLVQYLRAPDQMLAEQDPIAVALLAKYKNVSMPNLHLSDGETATVLSYLEAQRVASPPQREGQDSTATR
jgi:protein SCO1